MLLTTEKENRDGSRIVVIVRALSIMAWDWGDAGVHAVNLRCFNPQFFISSRVGDAALEADCGAFTRRFAQDMHTVVDAVRALSVAVPLAEMLPADRLALDRLQGLAQRMDQTGTGDNNVAALSTAEVDDLISRLRRLRRDDPDSAERILRRISEETAPAPARPE
jgi:hypothetical protein